MKCKMMSSDENISFSLPYHQSFPFQFLNLGGFVDICQNSMFSDGVSRIFFPRVSGQCICNYLIFKKHVLLNGRVDSSFSAYHRPGESQVTARSLELAWREDEADSGT